MTRQSAVNRLASSPIVWTGVIVGLVIGAANVLAGREPFQIVLAGLIPIAYGVVVTLLATRSETVSVLAGRPVDERWQHLNLEASTWAFGITAIVVLGVFVVAQASRGEWQPYAFVAVVMALAYVGSLAVLRVRG